MGRSSAAPLRAGGRKLDRAPGSRVICVSWALVGQGETKACAVWEVVGSPQAATMRFDDGAADAKAHAGSMGLGAKEGIEDLLGMMWGQAHAAVVDGDGDFLVFCSLRLDR